MRWKDLGTLLVVYSLFLASSVWAGPASSGGGGGVNKEGVYMTFYKAGFYTEPSPAQDSVEIPGLNALLTYVRDFPYVAGSRRVDLMDVLVPSESHKYYKVNKDHFDADTRARLIAEFSKVTGQPADQIVLYAVTDTKARCTYLLPEFYELKDLHDQMTILFHEAYWLLHPETDYPTIVGAETSFEAVMEQPRNMNRVYRLMKYWGDSGDEVVAMARLDQQTNALQGLLASEGIPFDQLLGTDYVNCWKSEQSRNCHKLLKINLFDLTQKYPNSVFLKTILSKVTEAVRQEDAGIYEEAFTFKSQYIGDSRIYSYQSTDGSGGCSSNETGVPLYIGKCAKAFLGAYYDDIQETLDLSKCYVSLDIDSKRFKTGNVRLPVQCASKTIGKFTFTMSWLGS